MSDSSYYFWLDDELLTHVLGALGSEFVTVSLLKTVKGKRIFKTRITSDQLTRLFLTGNYPDELDGCREVDVIEKGQLFRRPKSMGTPSVV